MTENSFIGETKMHCLHVDDVISRAAFDLLHARNRLFCWSATMLPMSTIIPKRAMNPVIVRDCLLAADMRRTTIDDEGGVHLIVFRNNVLVEHLSSVIFADAVFLQLSANSIGQEAVPRSHNMCFGEVSALCTKDELNGIRRSDRSYESTYWPRDDRDTLSKLMELPRLPDDLLGPMLRDVKHVIADDRDYSFYAPALRAMYGRTPETGLDTDAAVCSNRGS